MEIEKEKIIIYTLFGDRFVESYHPTCAALMRVLAYGKIPYDNKIITLQADATRFRKVINNLPAINDNGKMENSITGIMEFIKDHTELDPLLVQNPQDAAKARILIGWAASSLFNTGNYLSAQLEDNYRRFRQEVEKVYQEGQAQVKLFDLNRNNMIALLSYYPIGKMNYKEFINYLQLQLRDVEAQINNHGYLINNRISSADIFLYVYIHRMLHPFIKESTMIKENFPKLIDWVRRINLLTLDEHTRKITI